MALSNLYIFTYNNYFNRIIKKGTYLSAYGTPLVSQASVNFNPGDNVTTTHILGKTAYNGKGDYLVETDSEETIKSRWFIIDTDFNRQGQWVLSLKRDLIADNYNKICEAPMMVEKAMISSKDNPLLYNPEGFSFNQIKKQEILLQDKARKAWYVMYFKKGMHFTYEDPVTHETITTTEARGSITPIDNIKYDKKISTSLENSIYSAGSKKITTNEQVNLTYYVDSPDIAWIISRQRYKMLNKDSGISYQQVDYTQPTNSYIWFNNTQSVCSSQLNNAFGNQYSNLKTALLTDTGNTSQISESQYQELKQIGTDEYYVYSTIDSKLYGITVTETVQNISGDLNTGDTYTLCQTLVNSTTLNKSAHFGGKTVSYSMTVKTLTVATREITSGTYNWTIDFSVMDETEDSEFNIIAIPYQDVRFYNGNTYFYASAAVSELLVHSIARVCTSEWLVDIQLIPYCPDQNIVRNYLLDLSDYTDYDPETYSRTSTRYSYYNAGSIYNCGFILYVTKSNISFDITQALSVPSVSGDTTLDYKISNECDLYKIVSPNYNGSFEFSVAKNDGVNTFNVDMTLIPYNPYIHINPNFKALYGTDWNDSKGLICGGDFSLPFYTSAWETYKLQNKNFELIFDRQVRNLDFKQGQERISEYVNTGLGVLKGGTMGAAAGGSVGGAYGAIAGAAVGTVGSVVSGVADIALMNARQAEDKSFLLDNYKYQLGNIKALPDTINKVTPLTYNNKIYPFIEVYSCTPEEKDMLMNYIKYQSMTVNAIGSINGYKQSNLTFIKGQIIRLEDLDLDSHEAFEIYDEIRKGVYI